MVEKMLNPFQFVVIVLAGYVRDSQRASKMPKGPFLWHHSITVVNSNQVD